jgi:hypothetical protein
VPRHRLETLILQGVAFQSIRCPDFLFKTEPGDDKTSEACDLAPARQGSADAARRDAAYRRYISGSMLRGPAPEGLARGSAPAGRTAPAPGAGGDGGRTQSVSHLQSSFSAGAAHGSRSGHVLDSDQRPGWNKPTGYFHSLFSDIENINLLSVLPQRELQCIRHHSDEVFELYNALRVWKIGN